MNPDYFAEIMIWELRLLIRLLALFFIAWAILEWKVKEFWK